MYTYSKWKYVQRGLCTTSFASALSLAVIKEVVEEGTAKVIGNL